jgi:hypothetical protein
MYRDYGVREIEDRLLATRQFTEKQARRLARKIEDAMDNEYDPYYEETEKDMELIRQYDNYLEFLVNEMGYHEFEAYH